MNKKNIAEKKSIPEKVSSFLLGVAFILGVGLGLASIISCERDNVETTYQEDNPITEAALSDLTPEVVAEEYVNGPRIDSDEWCTETSPYVEWRINAKSIITEYQYSLDNGEWISTGEENHVFCENLSDGTHLFSVRAFNGKEWSKTGTFIIKVYDYDVNEKTYVNIYPLDISGAGKKTNNYSSINSLAKDGVLSIFGSLIDRSEVFVWNITDPCPDAQDRILSMQVTKSEGFDSWGGQGMFALFLNGSVVNPVMPDPDFAYAQGDGFIKKGPKQLIFRVRGEITQLKIKTWGGSNIDLKIEDLKFITP